MRVSLSSALRALLAAGLLTAVAQATPAGAESAENVVHMEPDVLEVGVQGGPFSIDIVVEDLYHDGRIGYDTEGNDGIPDTFVPSIGLGAFEFTIRYNPAVLSVSDIQGTRELGDRSFQCIRNSQEPGSTSFACFSPGSGDGPQGTLNLARIVFQPLAAGGSFLQLEAQLAGPLADDIPVDIKELGGVRVRGTGANPSPTTPNVTPGGPSGGNPTPSSGTPPSNGGPGTTPGSSAGGSGTRPSPGGNGGPGASGTGTPEGTPGNAIANGSGGEPGDSEASNAAGTSGGDGFPVGVMLWSLAAVGGLLGAGTLGFAAVRWQQR